MPEKDLQPLITKLAEAVVECPDILDRFRHKKENQLSDRCTWCDATGSILNPLTELLRVKCEGDLIAQGPGASLVWVPNGKHDHVLLDEDYDRPCECNGREWNSATSEEAEAVGLKLLAAFKLYLRYETYPHDGNHWVAGQAEGKSRRSGPPLRAILNVMATVVGVEVPDLVTEG